MAEDWCLDFRARSRDQKLPRFPLGLLLHPHVLQVQQEVLAVTEVHRCEHGRRQPQR
jgi:hypothetical protein